MRRAALVILRGTVVFVVAMAIGCVLLAAVMLPLWAVIRLADWLGHDAAQSVVALVGFWLGCIWFVAVDSQ